RRAPRHQMADHRPPRRHRRARGSGTPGGAPPVRPPPAFRPVRRPSPRATRRPRTRAAEPFPRGDPVTAPSDAATAARAEAAAAEEYFDALHRGDESQAIGVACGLLDSGTSAEDVLLRLVAPAQVRVGKLWQTGVWSIAQEHAASCIAERVVFAVGARTRR